MRSPPSRVEPGGFGIEDDFPHGRESIGRRRVRDKRECRATWLSVVDRSVPVSMTKSARARFSSSGIWRARIESSLAAVMPGPLEDARRAGPRAARTRRRPCRTRFSPPVSNSKGISNTSAGASRMAAMKRLARFAHCRVNDRLRARRAWRGSASTICARHSRSSVPQRTQPGNSSPIFSTRPPPGPCSARTTASASNTGTPARSNISRDRRLAHADRPGERDPDHASSSPRSRSAPSSGISGMPRIVKWSPSIAIEQLHAARLQPEHADSIADLGPFGIEIVGDEGVGQRRAPASVAVSTCRQSSLPPRASATALVRCIVLAREEAQVLRGFVAVARLVEQPSAGADHAVAADHPILRVSMLTRLGSGELRRDLAAASHQPSLERGLIDVGLNRVDSSTPAASSICRRIALVEARIRGKRTTLWKRGQASASPGLGSGLNRRFADPHRNGRSTDSSTGTKSIPRL